jgi:hydroxymethylbilane synthase
VSAIRLATRGSALALTQSGQVARALEVALGRSVELVTVRTTGDALQNVSLAKVGGKGLFIKEIEEALADGRADVAVHSAKDLPAGIPAGFALAAFPERADPRDALVTRPRGGRLAGLPTGARIGTGSVRRGSQLLALRPDLEIVPLRGNVDTRLRKLEGQGLDAVVLACAGLDRLDRAEVIDERIDPDALLPAVGQGVLALETRRGDPLGDEVRKAIDHAPTRAAIEAERAFLEGLEGDCTVPLGALATVAAGEVRLRALLAAADGSQVIRVATSGRSERSAEAGREASRRVLAAGGHALLASLAEAADD